MTLNIYDSPEITVGESINLVYKLDEKPKSIRDLLLFSAQWLVTMFYCVVWGYAVVGIGIDLTGSEFASYMATIVLMVGLSTLAQSILGHRFAMVSGPNIIPSLAIVAAYGIGGKEYALQSFTAQAIAGIVIALAGSAGLIGYISRVWSKLVLGSMVMMVGLSVSYPGISLLTSYGMGWPFFAGLGLALLAGVIAIRGKGLLSTIPTLVIVPLGYLIFIAAGSFNWGTASTLPLVTLPKLLPFGTSLPPLDLLFTMLIVNLMAALNMYGNVTGWGTLVGERLNEKQSRRSFTVFGLIETTLAGLLGVPGHVSYGENLGIITLTRVASRYFIIVASILFILASFIGPVSGFMAAMPNPVAGAILLGIASTVIGQGASIWASGRFGRREILIAGFSIFLSFGLSRLPQTVWETTPRVIATVFSNPIITVILLVILLEQVVFREPAETAK